jgi:hypothetical protein
MNNINLHVFASSIFSRDRSVLDGISPPADLNPQPADTTAETLTPRAGQLTADLLSPSMVIPNTVAAADRETCIVGCALTGGQAPVHPRA